jgi:peptidyl-prolyl cis-trans isomerase C
VRYKKGIKQLTLVVCAMALFACKPSSDVDTKKGGKELAEVNGKVITVEDFNAEVENLPPVVRQMAQSPEGKKELLDGMIFRELVLEQAKKDGIDKSKDVLARLESVKKMVIVEAFVKKKLEQDVKITDEEMKKFYEMNKDKFKTGEQLRTSHILVKSEPAAQDILAQLKKGANFEELARKNSVDGSASKGGDLGWFSKGTMVPEFEQAAWSLKEGEISGIVKTQYGFHIIKVTGKRPAGIRSYDEVKDQIKAAMLPSKQQEVLQNLKENLKKNAKISIKEDVGDDAGNQPAEKTPAPSASSK